jgi:predicted dehydrogenase
MERRLRHIGHGLRAQQPSLSSGGCCEPELKAAAVHAAAVTTVAIIGLGRQGSTISDEQPPGSPPFSVASACAHSNSLRLVAGCDLLPEKRAAFRDRWGVPAVYADYREMIAKEQPQLVAICTAACLPKNVVGPMTATARAPNLSRPDSHADLCVAVSDLGVPMVFCEKSIASSVERLDEISAAFSRNGTTLCTGQLRRYDSRYEAVRDAIAGGAIGRPTAAIFFGPFETLLHGHSHSVDTLSFLLGDPMIKRVRGHLLNDVNDVALTADALFSNGVLASHVPTGPDCACEWTAFFHPRCNVRGQEPVV